MCPWNNTKDCEETAIDEETIVKAIKILRGKNMERMKLSEIKISESFASTTPSEKKMEECRYNWRMYGKQDRFIIVNHNNVLIDGYVMYKVLMEHNEEYADVIYKEKHNRNYEKLPKIKISYKNTPTTYIYGIHPNSNYDKEFCWRVPASWGDWASNLQIGDTILCQTKFGYAPVMVNRIEVLDECPIDMPVKKVRRREIRRNGMVVEI